MFDLIDNLSANSSTQSSLSKFYDNCYSDEFHNFESISSESHSIIQGTISSSLEDIILLKSNIFGKMYCPKCMIPCSIIFNDNFSISFECGCSFIKYISIKEFINDYIKKEYFKNQKYTMHCQYHFEQTAFIKYCIDCEHDLCEKCMDVKYILQSNNKTTANKKHDNHSFINYDGIMEKFEIVNKLIEKYEDSVYFKIITDKNKKEKIQNVFQLIKCLIENYPDYKCYNLYKSIENAEIFLRKINEKEFKIDNSEYPLINLLKITSNKEFTKNIKDFSEKIISIHIVVCKTAIDLSMFKNKKFLNLKELTLVSDKIEDISTLHYCEFPVLEILSLGDNKIGNSIIDLLEKLILPELTLLNLYSNNITDIKLFEVIKKFEKLKHFFAGENQFEINKNPKDFYEFPKSLEEFGLTGNLEGDRCQFIKRLDISNLKIFYISRNKIDNLSYIENIKFKRLENFYSFRNILF